jgi:hypothetical protein
MQHLEGSGTPVLYIGRTVLKDLTKLLHSWTTTPLAANMARGLVLRNEGLEKYPN